MKSSITLLSLLLAATQVATQDGTLTTEEPVTAGASASSPESGGGAPSDCVPDEASTFNIKVDSDFKMKPKTSKRSFHPANIFKLKRQDTTISTSPTDLPACTIPILTLKSGAMTDQSNRVCEIVKNHQFQCDNPPGQIDAVFNTGWAVCPSESAEGSAGTLKIGESTLFYLRPGKDPESGRDFFNIFDSRAAEWEPTDGYPTAKLHVFPCRNEGGGPVTPTIEGGGGGGGAGGTPAEGETPPSSSTTTAVGGGGTPPPETGGTAAAGGAGAGGNMAAAAGMGAEGGDASGNADANAGAAASSTNGDANANADANAAATAGDAYNRAMMVKRRLLGHPLQGGDVDGNGGDGSNGGKVKREGGEEARAPVVLVEREVKPEAQGRKPFPMQKRGQMWWPRQ